MHRSPSCGKIRILAYYAHFVLNSTSLQLIPAYSSQSSSFQQTLIFP
jgi:hypothetical protein